jgi:hypothetical protein
VVCMVTERLKFICATELFVHMPNVLSLILLFPLEIQYTHRQTNTSNQCDFHIIGQLLIMCSELVRCWVKGKLGVYIRCYTICMTNSVYLSYHYVCLEHTSCLKYWDSVLN